MQSIGTEALRYLCVFTCFLACAALAAGPKTAGSLAQEACLAEDAQALAPADGLCMLQHETSMRPRTGQTQTKLLQESTPVQRVTINFRNGGHFERGDQEVVFLGGNYVLKAQPYFPDADVVRRNAKAMAEGARRMKYQHPNKTILPCVRLGTMFEGAMPEKGMGISSGWASKLNDTVQAFASEGVYVFLDIHQDALSSTNGGEGLPWWIAAQMQDTALHGESYIASPEHPLSLLIPKWLVSILKPLISQFPKVQTVPNDEDPWFAYAADRNGGNPAFMNAGNINMRLNNHDKAWDQGTLTWTRQMQNLAHRFFRSPFSAADRATFFDPYMSFVKHLCRVWEANTNVVAVELFNEPPMGGLPDKSRYVTNRRNLYDFYGAVLKELDQAWPPIQAPLAIEDIGGGVQGAGTLMDLLGMVAIHQDALVEISNWAWKGQLIFSFHYYQNVLTEVELPELVQLAKKQAYQLGAGAGIPVFLSEFWRGTAQGMADRLAQAAELGCDAVTFWQWVDTEYTGTDGWFKYPEAIKNEGDPISKTGRVNWKAWKLYEETVANGTFWGAPITGGRGGRMGVLELVPDVRSQVQVQPEAPTNTVVIPRTVVIVVLVALAVPALLFLVWAVRSRLMA